MPKGRSGGTDEASVLLDLVSLTYQAACNQELWPTFLTRFADAVGGTATAFHAGDLNAHEGAIQVAVRTDPDLTRDYDAYYSRINVWLEGSQRLLTTGNVVTSERAYPNRDFVRSEYYNDFLRRYDIFHSFAAAVLRENETVSMLSSCRPATDGPFGEAEVRLVKALLPHVARAWEIHQRLRVGEALLNSTSAALDRHGRGMIVIDKRRRVAYASPAAAKILRARDGLVCDGGELRASSSSETVALGRLVEGAIGTSQGRGTGAGGVMAVSRQGTRRALRIVVSPVSASCTDLGTRVPGALVFVTDPDRPAPAEDEIRSFLGLTHAEARLARALAEGLSVSQAAERFGVTAGTLRTRLKVVFQKTGTHRQAELVRAILMRP